MATFSLGLIVVGIFFGGVAAAIAGQKGRGELRWFIVGFLFHIIGLIVVFLPAVPKEGVLRKCPKCAEVIKAEATVCRYCGSEVARVAHTEAG
ncbi:MAG TPA: hypothetical protein HPP77_09280 [Candidatus Hydrogenedentes bacterium]|nr:hypothetical protein [Candidatus Hydrogenedentota bacterium]